MVLVTDVSLGYPVEEHTLANGMRVIVSTDHTAPVVAVNLWCHVGSRDEQLGRTGFAHLFEHIMFEGSANVASGEHMRLLEAAGGSVNATTAFDRTNFFETVPTGALDLALWLEADRLGGLLDSLDQASLDNQRDVVKEEKRQRYDNVPYGDVFEHLLTMVFPADHPYGHLPIGSMDDLDAATLDDVRHFFARHYVAANTTLVLAGDITAEEAFARAETYLGGLPTVPTPVRAAPGRPAVHDKPVRKRVRSQVPAGSVYLAWPVPPLTDPELSAVDLALDILGVGQTARLHRQLVRDLRISQGAGAASLPLHGGASVGYAYARALNDEPLRQLEDAVLTEITRLIEDGPTDAEVARARIQFERGWLNDLASVDDRADEINFCATHLGGPGTVNTHLDAVRSLTAADVQAAAARYLAPAAGASLHYEKEIPG